MNAVADTIATQDAVFASIDPMLPRHQAPPRGTPLSATLADGTAVHGVLYRAVRQAGSFERLWSANVTWEISPLLADSGADGMAAICAAASKHIAAVNAADDIHDVTLTWPSRDVTVMPALLRHGFIPQTALAIRSRSERTVAVGADSQAEVLIRSATRADLDDLVAIHLAELHYSASVTGRPVPDNAATLLASALKHTLMYTGRVLLAENDGLAVGTVEAGWAAPTSGTSIEHRLPSGCWGYIGTLSVLPLARGSGVGGALAAAAHRVLAGREISGTFLYYDLANPLSAVFWPRRGYRPLWTRWVRRRAGH